MTKFRGPLSRNTKKIFRILNLEEIRDNEFVSDFKKCLVNIQ